MYPDLRIYCDSLLPVIQVGCRPCEMSRILFVCTNTTQCCPSCSTIKAVLCTVCALCVHDRFIEVYKCRRLNIISCVLWRNPCNICEVRLYWVTFISFSIHSVFFYNGFICIMYACVYVNDKLAFGPLCGRVIVYVNSFVVILVRSFSLAL